MPLTAPIAIEPVQRAFRVLEALNRDRTATLAALARSDRAAEIDHSTAAGDAGRARIRDPGVAQHGLSHHRSRAGAGGRRSLHRPARAMRRPRPMSEFTAQTGWPLYLGTVSDALVLIRHSTAPESPMSFETAGYDRGSASMKARSGLPISRTAPPTSGVRSSMRPKQCAMADDRPLCSARHWSGTSRWCANAATRSPVRRGRAGSTAWPCRSSAGSRCLAR